MKQLLLLVSLILLGLLATKDNYKEQPSLADPNNPLSLTCPNSAQELFCLAYQSEFNGAYEAATGYYKEIASDYKDSNSTYTSLPA